MSKPDDIPQDVWMIAGGVYSDLTTVARDEWSVWDDANDQAIIARSILAAIEAEREACALVAERKMLPSKHGGFGGPTPENIATAIRNRAEAGREKLSDV